MYSKLPYIVPLFYYVAREKIPIFSVQACKKDKAGYRSVYGYIKAHDIKNTLKVHAYHHDKSLPCPKYK